MKINYEDYLHKIDLAFKNKTKKDIYMTYGIIVMSIFGFAYLLFWDSSFEGFQETRKSVASLEKTIDNDKRYLQSHPESKITQLEKDINKINTEVIAKKDANAYIKNKIETISSLIYDEQTWGEYLDSIATNAQAYNIKLITLINKYVQSESSFGHILDISIQSTGNFNDTLKFINSLEQSDLVVDLHNFNIKAEKSLHSDLNISVWGITY
jgi:septal ring factor EnvC (AmiA/AmiB activator)